jgi:predicted outer membrane repeat protein
VDRIEWALETYRPSLIEGTGYEGPVWHIATTGSDSTGDGSEENPFASIQFGLDSASESDTVSVSNGMYLENIIWPATNGIQLIGSGEENCVIDGDSTGRVITFHDSSNVNIDTTTHITGFTIQNGVSDLENITEKPGAGIYCVNASPMLTDCTIKENYAYGDGGGIALLDSSDMIIANIKFQDNMARGWRTPGQWPRYRGKGGGIFIVNSDPVLTNVEITDNYAGEYGGGVYLLYSSASFTNFTISGNIGSGSLQKGGGVSCESTPNATFTEGIIVDNVGPYLGGGIAVSPAMYDSSSFHVELTNVLIQNNTSRQWGGGIYGSNISLSGCTIKENTATYNGGGIYNEDFFSDGEISFSPTNRCNIYSNTVEDSSEVGNDIAINVDYYGIPQSFMEVILDTFTVLNPTDYYATPIDSFSFDILNGLETVAIDNEILPLEFALHPPYPNPFNPITTIRFDISVGEAIVHPLQLTVYDITGRVVDVLVNGKIESGQHEIQWNASQYSSGLYFVELVAGKKRDVQKLILLK